MASVRPCPGSVLTNRFTSPTGRISRVAQLLRDLAGCDVTTAGQAGERLKALAPTSGELVVLLSDRNSYVRSGAAWWLRQLQSDVPTLVTQALRAAIHDPNPHVAQAALGTAGVLRLAAARDDARKSLADSNPAVVHQAIFALGRIGPTEEGAHLVRFLHARELHLEKAAVTALTSLRYRQAIPALITRLEKCQGANRRLRVHFELPRRYMQALVALDARQAIPLLIRIARDEIGLRSIAVQALIDLHAEEAAPALLPLLERLRQSAGEERLCCCLLHLITAVDYRFARGQVRGFLEHPLSGVRIAALRAVAGWHDREALATVRGMARSDPSAFVRPVAVAALVEIAEAASLADLEALTDDGNALVRAAVAEGLGRLVPQPAALKLLERLACDATAAVATAARQALDCRGEAVVAAGGSRSPLVPAELTDQVTAARAFLLHWRSSFADDASDLVRSLDVVLASLR